MRSRIRASRKAFCLDSARLNTPNRARCVRVRTHLDRADTVWPMLLFASGKCLLFDHHVGCRAGQCCTCSGPLSGKQLNSAVRNESPTDFRKGSTAEKITAKTRLPLLNVEQNSATVTCLGPRPATPFCNTELFSMSAIEVSSSQKCSVRSLQRRASSGHPLLLSFDVGRVVGIECEVHKCL